MTRKTFFNFITTFLLLWPAVIHAKGVEALFSTDRTFAIPLNSIYPSNLFTVADATHNTGLRLGFLNPDCQVFVSYCEGLVSINELDGFNLQPHITVRFSGPIDVTTVNSSNFFLIRLGDALSSGDQSQKIVGINQISFHTENHVLSAESDEFLDEHTRYAVIVTREIRDSEGERVRISKEFKKFRKNSPAPALDAYWSSLQDAFRAAKKFKINESHIVAASVFTTQSATALLEKIRDQIKASTPAPADFNLGPNGERTVFPLNAVTAITHSQQVKVDTNDPAAFEVSFFSPFLVPLLQQVPGAIHHIAYGKYRSPNYLVSGQVMPMVGTRTGTPIVQETDEVFFTVFLPSGTKPPGGWPVAIYGHGSSGNKDGESYRFASRLAARGIATIAISAVGHGSGALSTLTINQGATPPVTFLSGGRGFDQNNDGTIALFEGLSAIPPRGSIAERDGLRQTVVDLMQLVREIEVGMDIDGDTTADLDPSRIYYFGVSLGGMYGTIFLAVEPKVRAGVPTVSGGPFIEIYRLSPLFRPFLGPAFAADGQVTIDPDGSGPLFETPIAGPSPENCGFVVPIPGFTACP